MVLTFETEDSSVDVELLVEKWVNLRGENGARMNLVKFHDDLRRRDI
jgi:hypothetical protein